MRAVIACALIALSVSVGCVNEAPASTFTEVYAAFFPVTTQAQCNKCHSLPPNQISNGLLSMGEDQASAYAALMGVTSTSEACGGQELVVAGDPDNSLLYTKSLATAPCADRMPLGGSAFTDVERTMLRSWIAAGAEDN